MSDQTNLGSQEAQAHRCEFRSPMYNKMENMHKLRQTDLLIFVLRPNTDIHMY